EYVDFQIEHEKEIREEWRKMNDQMVKMAKEYVDSKLEKMNEMREQITAERGQYQNRLESRAEYNSLDLRLQGTEKTLSNYQGRIAVVGGVFGLIVVLIGHFWK